jgi:hypothetical protein
MSIDLHDNDFDDFIKNKYEGHTSSPPEAYWNEIEARLNAPKGTNLKRHITSYWLPYAAAAALLLAISTYFVFTKKTTKILHYSDSANLTMGDSAYEDKANTLQYSNTIGNPESIKSIADKKNNTVTANHEYIGNKPTEVKAFSKNKESQKVKSEQKNIRTEPVSNNSDNINLSTNKVSTGATISIESSELVNHAITFQAINDTSLKDIKPIPETDSKPINTIALNENTNYKQGFDSILPSGLPPDNFNSIEALENNTRLGLKKRLSFEMFFTPGFTFRTVTNNQINYNPEYNKAYFDKRDKGAFTFAAGLLLNFKASEKISVSTGVTYSQYSQGFSTESFHLNYTDSQNAWLYTSNGDLYFKIISTDTISQNDILRSSIRFSYINIPILFKYRFAKNYFVDAGLSLNLLINQSFNLQAENFDGEFEATPINDLERINFILNLGIGREFTLRNKFSLVINPGINFYLTSINNDATVKSYPFTIGLQAGLKYSL